MTNKQIIAIIKSAIDRKTALSILETVYLNNDLFTVYDLQTYLSIPYHSGGIKACIHIKDLDDAFKKFKQPVFHAGENFNTVISGNGLQEIAEGSNPEEYPVLPLHRDITFQQIGTWSPQEIGYLKKALSCVGTDDLRPALTGVFAGKNIVGTDAHRLYCHAIKPAIKPGIIIPAKAAKIISKLPETNWKLFYGIEHCFEEIPESDSVKKGKKSKKQKVKRLHAYFISDEGIIVGFRPIDARFPNYVAVIPKDKAPLKMTAASNDLQEEITKAMECANPKTHQVVFSLNGTAKISASDVDTGTEYENEIKARYRFKNPSDHNEFIIAFDGELLNEILEQIEGKATFELRGSTRCAIINKKFLLMPLMLHG